MRLHDTGAVNSCHDKKKIVVPSRIQYRVHYIHLYTVLDLDKYEQIKKSPSTSKLALLRDFLRELPPRTPPHLTREPGRD